ncbi:zinc-ribbon domain-containing protein [Microbacterium telephonicum]|uniref:Putative zinc ribbon protein n=1 Tax=Microbacterium telephonicum TaxID=1714841 RepID=A0A498C3K3_9MICO|nr:zinc-ribbon domain-containing protein [Microbacterium telephonicum]RLK47448.1 putative zinc ribbon protein [Microbacterium telephonicum]
MAERIEDWWARRRFSRDRDIPYDVGTYRDAWRAFPMLVRQYHPELNAGIALSQIPPAADVLLLWQCEAGHLFVATPTEQRSRPGGRRRRSAWCPDCAAGAVPPRIVARPRAAVAADAADAAASPTTRNPTLPRSASSGGNAGAQRSGASRRLCAKTPHLDTGTAFHSECAPRPASAAEDSLRAAVFASLAVTPGMNAVRVARPFFEHVEVWPDILLPELRVAVEYDTTGRFGLEHVGPREESDRRKDRLLREAGWEVIRLRASPLRALGPHDVTEATTSKRTVARLLDALRDIRGPLIVDAYAM